MTPKRAQEAGMKAPLQESLLQRVKLVENMGTGISKIRRLLREAKCAGPRFEFGSFFTIVFPRAEKRVEQGTRTVAIEDIRHIHHRVFGLTAPVKEN